MPRLNTKDVHHWNEGTHWRSYERLGAHPNQRGCWFAVWAPHAEEVSVIGDFNTWNPKAHPLRHAGGGLWEAYIRGAKPGQHYKYHIRREGYQADKTDPYAFALEAPSHGGSAVEGLASIITSLDYSWNDQEWMDNRSGPESLDEPISIYEVHLGSWRHHRHGTSLSYRELADELADYVSKMGFTHVELLPVMEHPYYGSWGYQVLGYYAPTFRYGTPEDFMYFVDTMHQRGIGVILDWVPAHFATDPQGLVHFDGTPLFEYEDPVMRHHPDWGTYVFDYNKPGVRNFLISNALFWLDRYHIDGLRVDAVASMLYRDYSREEWTPNLYGGRENLEAIDLLKKTNEAVYTHFPDAIMLAEESTAWPGVSKPTYDGGLGFLYKWNMGWMHDTLEYMEKDPVHRKYHHGDFSYPLMYAFSEHFTLPLSHDEVVHGKGSLWGKMPGDAWQKAANLRLLYGHMYGHPGKKLLFMGSEFGQRAEWSHDHSIDWHLLDNPLHEGVQRWVAALNKLYRSSPALWKDKPEAFEWIDFSDDKNTVAVYRRQHAGDDLVFAFNFTPVPREHYRIGMPREGAWRERLNSDSERYGGSGLSNGECIETNARPFHGRPASIEVTIPPLGVLVLKPAA